jgi:hypothetical protein
MVVAFAAAGARAGDRPSEDELFGAPPARAEPAPEARPADRSEGKTSAPHGDTEAELFGTQSPPAAPTTPTGRLIPREQEDWLKVGGLLQLRAQSTAYQDVPPSDWPFASPNLLDVYLDSRPNDRVRGFVLGRFSYDPAVADATPQGVLDQFWVNFDLDHRAFVTAGRQHVKWGVGKFWNPTDYLHPVKLDPLATFDARAGTTMLKVHLPWEKLGWNFYAMALLEDLAGDTGRPANRLGRIGGAARAEIVLGPTELGLDAAVQDGHHPRFGVDLSGGLGDFDLHSELALRTGGDDPHWIRAGTPAPGPYADLLGWVPDTSQRVTPQVVVGGTWSYKYSDEDSLSVTMEYFYNDLGYDDPSVYPYLLLGAPAFTTVGGVPVPTGVRQDPTAFQPFYLGRHYAAASLYLPKPGSWNDTNISLTVLGNLSDRSWVARLDASVLVLTYLTVETYVAGHFGREGGEFRLTIPPGVAALMASQPGAQAVPAGAPVVDAGIGLRLSL